MIEREQLVQFWQQHARKLIGALIGFVLGLFIMWVGLFWTIVIAATTFGGYWLGSLLDDDPGFVPDWIERLLPGGRR